MVNVLFVFTNHGDLGSTGNKTGWYLPEVAHPYYHFKEKCNYSIDFCSPKGGKSPMDPLSGQMFAEDPGCKRFLTDEEAMKMVDNTAMAKDVDFKKYQVLFFPGGHGPMFDLADNEETNSLAVKVYENNGVVCAVCHGTAGIVNTKLSDGTYLVKGKKLTSFTNSEENAVKLMEAMPFALESKLKEHGGDFVDGGDWQCNVQVSGRVVTGQNPQSAEKMAEEVAKCVAGL